jgi:NADH-quinone oxidoreductase subunit H
VNNDLFLPLFWVLVFPGLLFTALLGMVVSWVDRKVTARVQWRVGPPLLQPFYDFVKLLGKETIVPAGGSRLAFLGAPVMGLAGVTLVATIVGVSALWREHGFVGDIIVVLYLLAVPSLAVILGAAASRNPLASVGASREMKLLLGYELPFILALLVPVVKTGGMLRIGDLMAYQAQNGSFASSLSGVLALVVAILCTQAKLALVPFDQAEAETELMGGALVEYSGTPLAIFKLVKSMMLVVVPMVVVAVLWGGFGASIGSALLGLLKFIVLVVIVVLMRNTNPRVRIDQAMKFFWGPVTILAVLAVIAAVAGV